MADNIWIREIWCNNTENCIIDDTDFYETFTSSKKELFEDCQKEYGECVSKMYKEFKNQADKICGWVFQKNASMKILKNLMF